MNLQNRSTGEFFESAFFSEFTPSLNTHDIRPQVHYNYDDAPDALESPRLLTDSSQATAISYTYYPYGESSATVTDSDASANRYRFTGREYETGYMNFYRSRYYNNRMARFFSKDSWQGDFYKPLSINKYLYVEGNPVNYIDPNGDFYYSTNYNNNFLCDPTINGMETDAGWWPSNTMNNGVHRKFNFHIESSVGCNVRRVKWRDFSAIIDIFWETPTGEMPGPVLSYVFEAKSDHFNSNWGSGYTIVRQWEYSNVPFLTNSVRIFQDSFFEMWDFTSAAGFLCSEWPPGSGNTGWIGHVWGLSFFTSFDYYTYDEPNVWKLHNFVKNANESGSWWGLYGDGPQIGCLSQRSSQLCVQ